MAEGALGKSFRDGEIVFRQGEAGDCMYVVQGGQAEVLLNKDDIEVCIAVLGEGDIFGEMALFEQEVRSATLRARGQLRVLTLDKRTFLRRVHEDPSLAFRILERMSHRIRELNVALKATLGRRSAVRL